MDWIYGKTILITRGIPQFTIMLENDEFADGHIPSDSGMVIFKHINDGLP